MKRVKTEAALRDRLARILLAYGAFRLESIMRRESRPRVLRALARLIVELEDRDDPRAIIVRRVRAVFQKSTHA